MKIHLIKTPELPQELLESVHELLCAEKGPMEFVISKPKWTEDDFRKACQTPFSDLVTFDIDSEYYRQEYFPELGYPLSWRELFSLCDRSREILKIPDDDFVILLTNRRNSMNFFSMFDTGGKRNAFVQCSDWEFFLQASPVFPAAYETVSNVLQILMNFDIEVPPEMNFHMEPVGCINDFCENKTEILLKLRTADICHDCLQRAKAHGITPEILMQSLEIFESVRKAMKFAQGFVGNLQPKKLTITHDCKIFIGEDEIELKPLEKVIFILFLRHPEGIVLRNLGDYKQEMNRIYEKLRFNPDPDRIAFLANPNGTTFRPTKSRLHKNLESRLGKDLAQYYTISGTPGKAFRIALPQDYREMEFDF